MKRKNPLNRQPWPPDFQSQVADFLRFMPCIESKFVCSVPYGGGGLPPPSNQPRRGD